MDWISQQISTMNVAQLIAIAAFFRVFYNRLGKKIDKLDEKITDIDRRLCRLEGAFSSKDCCIMNDHRINEKAE